MTVTVSNGECVLPLRRGAPTPGGLGAASPRATCVCRVEPQLSVGNHGSSLFEEGAGVFRDAELNRRTFQVVLVTSE